MEAFQEAIAAAKEQSLILKGKRTKRQRPQSPIPFSVISPTRDMEEKSTDLESSKDNALGNNVETRKKDGVNVITSSSSSASWTSNNINPTLNSKEDDEDQDIANCLILLAQGHSLPQQLKTPYNHQTNINRFSSRKFLETSSSSNGTGTAGYYVYQCKTCDRTFPSFQALGGHRASHKKPKATSFYTNLDLKKNIYENDIAPTYNKNRSLVVYGKSSNNNKVHECGICGAEFTSGQALGGHMRRHRGGVVVPVTTVAPSTVANTELSLSPMSFDQVSDSTQDHNLVMPMIKRAKKTVVSLDLDLNLPAPEDENRFMNFALKQKHEQEVEQREEPKSLVLSTPTLVDCHY